MPITALPPLRIAAPRWAAIFVVVVLVAFALMGPIATRVEATPAVAVPAAAAEVGAVVEAFPAVATFEVLRAGAVPIAAVRLAAPWDGICQTAIIKNICGGVSAAAGAITDPIGTLLGPAMDMVDSFLERTLSSFANTMTIATGLATSSLFARATGTTDPHGGSGETRWRVRSPEFRDVYGRMIVVGFYLSLPMLVLAAIQSLFEQKATKLLRAVFIVLPAATIGMIAAVYLVQQLVDMTDALSNYIAEGTGEDIARFTNGMSAMGQELGRAGADVAPGGSSGVVGGVIGNFIMSMVALSFAALAAFFVWMSMLVRDMGVMIASLFMPVGFALAVWPGALKWAKRLVELIIAFIFSKILIVGVLALAASLLAGPDSDYATAASELDQLKAPLMAERARAQAEAATTTLPGASPVMGTTAPVGLDPALASAAGVSNNLNADPRGWTPMFSADLTANTDRESTVPLTRLLLGGMIFFLGAFAPFTVMKMIPVAEAGMAAALEGREKQLTDKAKASGNNSMNKANMALGIGVNARTLSNAGAAGGTSSSSAKATPGSGSPLGPQPGSTPSAGEKVGAVVGGAAEGAGEGGSGGSGTATSTATSTNNTGGSGGGPSSEATPGAPGGMGGTGGTGGTGGGGGGSSDSGGSKAPPGPGTTGLGGVNVK